MNGNITENQEIPESVIIIKFAAPSSTLVEVKMQNVMPGQLIFVGEYLKQRGLKFMEQQDEQRRIENEANKIVKPNSNLIVPR